MTLLVIVHSVAPVNLHSSYFFFNFRLERGPWNKWRFIPVRVSFKLGGANSRHTVAKL